MCICTSAVRWTSSLRTCCLTAWCVDSPSSKIYTVCITCSGLSLVLLVQLAEPITYILSRTVSELSQLIVQILDTLRL